MITYVAYFLALGVFVSSAWNHPNPDNVAALLALGLIGLAYMVERKERE